MKSDVIIILVGLACCFVVVCIVIGLYFGKVFCPDWGYKCPSSNGSPSPGSPSPGSPSPRSPSPGSPSPGSPSPALPPMGIYTYTEGKDQDGWPPLTKKLSDKSRLDCQYECDKTAGCNAIVTYASITGRGDCWLANGLPNPYAKNGSAIASRAAPPTCPDGQTRQLYSTVCCPNGTFLQNDGQTCGPASSSVLQAMGAAFTAAWTF